MSQLPDRNHRNDSAPSLLNIRSDMPGIVWPPLAGGMPASLLALMHQLEASQWLAPEQLAAGQSRQLAALTRHAAAHSASFRTRMATAGLGLDELRTPAGLAALPILRRREIQSERHQLLCDSVPPAHLPLHETSSSGSTGEPVAVTRTAINQLFWLAFTLREHLWHQRDFSGTLAVIRASLPSAQPITQADWGAPVSLFFPSGPAHAMRTSTDVGAQLDWLLRIDPQYLLVYPSNLAALLDECEARNITLPGLRQIRSFGENLAPAIRQRAMDVLNVAIADTYSSQELGVIAIQCPASGLYHAMAEGYVVEVLDEQGRSCQPGEIGRLVVTDLHNFATPLIRYDTGDYAQASAPCPCGRCLPTIERVAGRERNMVVVNGSRRWPLFGFDHFLEIAPIAQYQLVQQSAELIEVRLVCSESLTADQEQRLADLIRESLGHPFTIRFTLFPERIPASTSGKFEEFICMVKP
ncbi:phenylacetate--CoA ligase family protein [Noviherbaspirillum cavernae]|uniref:Phenylacetate--CoA ligase family protein n=1 Tax=Noviherbaspirillum cavernae TaxID=2320862 RepID=A0A418X4J0_9BURK|nr:AMP-binding protein [Noviherbaspirillum cavernae]RJG07397.1 phenylacetate--CoA ligase family protein [Noviherbaspirillum cavernae]